MLLAPAATFIIVMPATHHESQGPPVAKAYTLANNLITQAATSNSCVGTQSTTLLLFKQHIQMQNQQIPPPNL